MNVVIYTAIFGNLDELIEPHCSPNADLVCFTDRPRHSRQWQVRDWHSIAATLPSNIPGHVTSLSRYFKLLPHRHFPDHDYSIWIDGVDELRNDPAKLIPFGEDLIQFKHPERNCLYRELEAIVRWKKDSLATSDRLKIHYRKLGVPDNCGLAACSMLWRRHCPATNEFNERWWAEFVATNTLRDQPAWAYCQWRQPISVRLLPGNHMRNEFVVRHPHKRRLPKV